MERDRRSQQHFGNATSLDRQRVCRLPLTPHRLQRKAPQPGGREKNIESRSRDCIDRKCRKACTNLISSERIECEDSFAMAEAIIHCIASPINKCSRLKLEWLLLRWLWCWWYWWLYWLWLQRGKHGGGGKGYSWVGGEGGCCRWLLGGGGLRWWKRDADGRDGCSRGIRQSAWLGAHCCSRHLRGAGDKRLGTTTQVIRLTDAGVSAKKSWWKHYLIWLVIKLYQKSHRMITGFNTYCKGICAESKHKKAAK